MNQAWAIDGAYLGFSYLKNVFPGSVQSLQEAVSFPTAAKIQNPGRQKLGPVPRKLLHMVSDSGADDGKEWSKGLFSKPQSESIIIYSKFGYIIEYCT